MSRVISYKGYVVRQNEFNNHIIVYEGDKVVMHANCLKPKSVKELMEVVDNFLAITEEVKPQVTAFDVMMQNFCPLCDRRMTACTHIGSVRDDCPLETQCAMDIILKEIKNGSVK